MQESSSKQKSPCKLAKVNKQASIIKQTRIIKQERIMKEERIINQEESWSKQQSSFFLHMQEAWWSEQQINVPEKFHPANLLMKALVQSSSTFEHFNGTWSLKFIYVFVRNIKNLRYPECDVIQYAWYFQQIISFYTKLHSKMIVLNIISNLKSFVTVSDPSLLPLLT